MPNKTERRRPRRTRTLLARWRPARFDRAMGYAIFLRTSLDRVEEPWVEWMSTRGLWRTNREKERVDREITLAASRESAGWVSIRDDEHFDLGAECEDACRAMTSALACVGVYFECNFDLTRIVLVDRGEMVDVLEEHHRDDPEGPPMPRRLRGRPERWAEALHDPSLLGALEAAMNTEIEDELGEPFRGLVADEVAVALGIREVLFPLESEEEPVIRASDLLDRLFPGIEEALPFRREPAAAREAQRKLDAARAAIGVALEEPHAPEHPRIVLDFRRA